MIDIGKGLNEQEKNAALLLFNKWEKEDGGMAEASLEDWTKKYFTPLYSAYDHVSIWMDGNGKLHLVSHPYALGHNDMAFILDQCHIHNLEYTIRGDSWYYPGRSLMIELTEKEEE